MHRIPVQPRRVLLAAWFPLAALVLVLLTVPETDGIGAARPSVTAVDPSGSSALRVRLAPEDGTLIPDTTPIHASKSSELAEMLSRSDEGLTVERLPNGVLRAHLQGRFQNASVARIDADGVLHTRCSDRLPELETHPAGCTHAPRGAKLEVK
jgi:hypothetical protein